MEDENTTASELARLKAQVAQAAARQAQEEENLERATRGVTEAMVAQADAARARVDSAYGYQKALLDQQQAMLDVTDAQTKLDEARASGDPAAIAQAELDYKNALQGVNDALLNRVKLAGDVAMSKLPAAMADDQKAILGAKASLEELNRIIAEGTVLDPDMEAYRQTLIGIVNGADQTMLAQQQLAAALREVGVAVTEIPGTASVVIDDNSPEVIEKLRALGFEVKELPDGKVQVTPITDEAKAALGGLSSDLATLNTTVATPTVDANTNPFAGRHAEAMGKIVSLNGQRPTPIVDANAIPFNTAMSQTLAGVATLNRQRPTPVISAVDNASYTIASIQNALASIRDKTVSVTVRAVNVQNAKAAIEHAGGASGGSVGDVLARGETGVARFAGGGPTTGAIRYGSGGPWDDQVDIKVSPGEHILDFGDVQAMGGQEAVYDFRRMLHSGYNAPGPDNAIRSMVTVGAAEAPVQSVSPRSVALYTPDIPAAIRALKAQEHEEAALAPVW
jgi:hypothetical protein